jgi:carboxylesterase type B
VGMGARLQAGTGQSLVFYYSFRQQPPFPAASVYADWGASHFAELWYVFDHLDQSPWNWTAGDRQLAEEMSSYWVNFARSGDPNSRGLPPWPAFNNVESKVRYLGDPITVGGVAKSMALAPSMPFTQRCVASPLPRGNPLQNENCETPIERWIFAAHI